MVVAGVLASPVLASAGTPAGLAPRSVSAPMSAPMLGQVGALSSMAVSAFAASTPMVHGAAAPAPGAVLAAAAAASRPAGIVPVPEEGASHLMVAAGASAPEVGQAAMNPAAVATQPRRSGDRVIIRKPTRDYGSGYLGDYGRLRRLTAPVAQFRAAAASDNGCLIIGDSIASMSKEAVLSRLRRSHSAVCAWDTWSGRPTEGTANALADHRSAYGLPSTIIVMAGSNDIFNPPLFAAQVRRVLDVVGEGRRVIWVNVYARRNAAKRYDADVRNSALVNRALADTVAGAGSVQIVDWYGFVTTMSRRSRPYLMDGIHPNAAGQRALADLLSRAW